MAKGGSINKPKPGALRKKNRVKNKLRRQHKKPKGKSQGKPEVPSDPLLTKHIARKRLTNPKANITISGKKRRLLMKQLKGELRAKEKKLEESKAPPRTKPKNAMDVDD